MIARQYFGDEFISANRMCKSSYRAALIHARELTGRSIHDGRVMFSEKTGNWAGACMYLILIDHIGNKFANNRKIDSGNIRDFIHALDNFTELEIEDREVLYQLRNSFLHKFNLYHLPKKNTHFLARHFSVNIGDVLIQKPSENFDGNLKNFKETNVTRISLKKLGDMVEEMHNSLLRSIDSNDLVAKLPEETSFEEFLIANILCYKISSDSRD